MLDSKSPLVYLHQGYGIQRLHLSARTRYRWSLRFQVSRLTLRFRRTNRFGPVDFLPRIFAVVAALRLSTQNEAFMGGVSCAKKNEAANTKTRLLWYGGYPKIILLRLNLPFSRYP
jgi:hypothetical protein